MRLFWARGRSLVRSGWNAKWACGLSNVSLSGGALRAGTARGPVESLPRRWAELNQQGVLARLWMTMKRAQSDAPPVR